MPFRFAFDTNSGKYGYITESGGADSFVPFRGVGEFDTFVKRIVGSATNQYQTYTFNVEEGANYFFTLYTLNASGGGRIRKITGGSYEILAGRYVSDAETTSVYMSSNSIESVLLMLDIPFPFVTLNEDFEPSVRVMVYVSVRTSDALFSTDLMFVPSFPCSPFNITIFVFSFAIASPPSLDAHYNNMICFIMMNACHTH